MSVKGRVLSETPEGALQDVIKIASTLVDLLDREANDLAMNNAVSFASVQNEKEIWAQKYEQASIEFQARVGEFRNVDKSLLARFETVQDELKNRAEKNAKLLAGLKKRQGDAISKRIKTQGADES